MSGKILISDKMPASELLQNLVLLFSNHKNNVFGTTQKAEIQRETYDAVIRQLGAIEVVKG